MSFRNQWNLLLILGLLLSGCGTGSTPSLPAAPPTALEIETASPTVEAAPSPTVEPPPWPPESVAPWPSEAIAPWPTQEWSYSSPEAQGIDSEILVEMLEYLRGEETNFHGLMLIRNGYVVLEAYRPPFDADERHVQFSATKSIVSTLVGLAIRDGYIEGVDQPLLGLFPGATFENMDSNKEMVTVADLLTMRDGFEGEGPQPLETLNMPIEHSPGTTFQYGNLAPRLLAATVQQATGLDTFEYARKNLFDAIGICEDDVSWSTIGGVRDGGTGLSMTPRAMAKIGYLYLHQGMWDSAQVLPAEWIAQSTFPHVEDVDVSPLADSYGYFWWIDRSDGYYAAIGYDNQLILVMPESNMIFVSTAGRASSTLRIALNEYIVALEAAEESLPENPEAAAALEALIAEFAQSD